MTMPTLLTSLLGIGLLILSNSAALAAPAVTVTLSLETNRIAVGATTLLHAYARIAPAYEPNADRIFSWYVDLTDSAGNVALPQYDQLVKPTSDRNPRTSSLGQTVGADRLGMYDTFINRSGAGRGAPVELFTVPVQGLAPGKTRFSLRAGTSVSNLAADFIVAPVGGGPPWLGGDYGALASVELEVAATEVELVAHISVTEFPTPQGRHVVITYPVQSGWNYLVEFRDSLSPTSTWQALPGGPHNSGRVEDASPAPQRYYRVRIVAASSAPVRLAIVGQPGRVILSYPVISGVNCTIEYRDSLSPTSSWQALPGGPHNSGQVEDTPPTPQRFYRLRIGP